jgi:phospholipase/lecithinase/hemolysin
MKVNIVIASLLILVFAGISPAHAKNPPAMDRPNFKKLVVFGESTSDIGNTWVLTGREIWDPTTWEPTEADPYGLQTLPTEPVPPLYDNGRWSNGPMWVEELSERLGIRGRMTPSLDGGLNYAFTDALTGNGPNVRFSVWTGEPILDERGFPIYPVPGIGDQIEMYADNEVTVNEDHLVVLWVGANEILFSLESENPEAALATAIGNIRLHIIELVELGAKHILVPNQIDPSSAPFFANNPIAQQAVQAATVGFNALLAEMLQALMYEIEGDVTIYAMDFHALGEAVVESECFDTETPASFFYLGALAEGVPLEIDDPFFDNFVFWDTVHPTAAVHALLAKAAYKYIKKGKVPSFDCSEE